MKTIAIILYGSPTKLTKAHKPVHTVGNPNMPKGAKAQPPYYVRMKVMGAMTDLDALMHSKPKPGETVLNTVEVEIP